MLSGAKHLAVETAGWHGSPKGGRVGHRVPTAAPAGLPCHPR